MKKTLKEEQERIVNLMNEQLPTNFSQLDPLPIDYLKEDGHQIRDTVRDIINKMIKIDDPKLQDPQKLKEHFINLVLSGMNSSLWEYVGMPDEYTENS